MVFCGVEGQLGMVTPHPLPLMAGPWGNVLGGSSSLARGDQIRWGI